MASTTYAGTILRIKCDYLCFVSGTPYDGRCDREKTGTGFLMRFNGESIVVTAHHVVSNAVTVTCTSPSLDDGETRVLKIVGYNPHLDVAFLSGPEEIMSLPAFVSSPSSTLAPKQPVTCVGFAGGDRRTHLTSGTISARNEFPHNRIQTDTAINPGNSGGPMLDAERGTVVGVVTSGVVNMQATNFFTPIEEVYLSYRRIVRASVTSDVGVGIDLGHTLSAIVRAVDSAACDGQDGGALVVAADPLSGLEVGDVITGIVNTRKQLLDINSHMRVNDPTVWRYDAIDFRTMFDVLEDDAPVTTCDMRVRRNAQTSMVTVRVGPSLVGTRPLFPDCEMVYYVAFAGVVVMSLSVSHAWEVQNVSAACLRDPKLEMDSAPMITHVASGSPFSMHGATQLVGSLVTQLVGPGGVARDVRSLADVERAVREIDPTILVLDTGARVGARASDVSAYDAQQTDEALRRGLHGVMRGPVSRVLFNPLRVDDEPEVQENEYVIPITTARPPSPPPQEQTVDLSYTLPETYNVTNVLSPDTLLRTTTTSHAGNADDSRLNMQVSDALLQRP